MEETNNEVQEDLSVEGYRIKVGKEYYVDFNEYNGKRYYKIIFYQKDFDGNVQKFFKSVMFKGNPDIEKRSENKT